MRRIYRTLVLAAITALMSLPISACDSGGPDLGKTAAPTPGVQPTRTEAPQQVSSDLRDARMTADLLYSSAAFKPTTARVPILMYHYVRVNPNPRDKVGADLSVSPTRFDQQVAYLSTHGYHTITFDDLVGAIRYGDALPAHPIMLTFDDGYGDFYTNAYPVLERYGAKATSFVITGKVGRGGYLTWDEMREMQKSGLVQFESHTVNHVEMNQVSLTRAQKELVDSKADLEQHLGTQVLYFCYPSGRYSASVEALLKKDGYLAAVTTKYGTVHSPSSLLALTRVRVHGGEPLEGFIYAIGAR